MSTSIKDKAQQFLNLAGLGKAQEAFDGLVAEDFVHHNQHFAGDRASLLRAIQEDHANNPNRSLTVKQCFVEGNHVITHSHVIKKDLEIAVVHIFRFDTVTGKILELWDLGEAIQANSPNEHGVF